MQKALPHSLTCLISCRDDFDNPSLWYSNGYSQNVKFFYDLLEGMGHRPVLLVGRKVQQATFPLLGRQYRVASPSQLAEQGLRPEIAFDAAVTIGADVREFLRERFDTRIVVLRYGPSMVVDMEHILYSEVLGAGIHVGGADMTWTSPHYTYSMKYLETLYRCPCTIAPYIWEPEFLTRSTYQDNAFVRDIYVMEPNISVIKNALIPMAIIEEVYRTDPEAFGKAMILNAGKFSQRTYFLENIVRNMGAMKAEHKKVFFTDRYRFDEVFQRPDVLLGHQWNNELNYLYLEALWRGIPLVHNSERLAEVGYFYPDFEVDVGRDRLLEALRSHRTGSDLGRNEQFLHRFSIHNPEVRGEYQRLLDEVMDRPTAGA